MCSSHGEVRQLMLIRVTRLIRPRTSTRLSNWLLTSFQESEVGVVIFSRRLRFVGEEGQIRPVGGNEPSQIDVRFIAATNRDLQREVKAGRFRQDLLFRMNILQIELPPLRSRKSDIPPLVALFLAKHKDLNSSIRAISDDAMRLLVSYHWPGNVRELEHSIEHAFAMGDGPAIEIDDLPPSLSRTRDLEALPLDETLTLQELERRAIFRALKETRGDRLEAARLLNIGKTTLYRRLKQYQRDMTCER